MLSALICINQIHYFKSLNLVNAELVFTELSTEIVDK
ncbi:Uncharacterised protein [Legionella waltersii]|nr:Uncharacterised protein [Legionella waltersii]